MNPPKYIPSFAVVPNLFHDSFIDSDILDTILADPSNPILLPSFPLYILFLAYSVYVVFVVLSLADTCWSRCNITLHHPLSKNGRYMSFDVATPPSAAAPDMWKRIVPQFSYSLE